MSPSLCLTGDAGPNQHCYFSCDPGFRVTGNPVRSCLPTLKWNPARAPPTCEQGKNHFQIQIWLPGAFFIHFHSCLLLLKILLPLGARFAVYYSFMQWSIKGRNNMIQVTVLTTTSTTTATPPTKTFPYSSNLPPLIHGFSGNNLIHFTPGENVKLR